MAVYFNRMSGSNRCNATQIKLHYEFKKNRT